jgi:hypothetical protein
MGIVKVGDMKQLNLNLNQNFSGVGLNSRGFAILEKDHVRHLAIYKKILMLGIYAESTGISCM